MKLKIAPAKLKVFNVSCSKRLQGCLAVSRLEIKVAGNVTLMNLTDPHGCLLAPDSRHVCESTST